MPSILTRAEPPHLFARGRDAGGELVALAYSQ
jgi:hypothetical protein